MEGKKKFEVKTHIDPYTGLLKKDIFIDDKLFEWEADPKSWNMMTQMGPAYVQAAKKEIMKHFLDSLSEEIGRKITAGEFMVATQKGWI